MRAEEIKFRGKRLDNGEWVIGFLVKMWGEWHIIDWDDENTAFPIHPDTIGQFIGLHDKNGNEIYEEDIVCLGDAKRRIGVILKSEMKPAFILEVKDTDYDLYYRNQYRYEIIGNIHDNKDLLED